MMWRHYLTICKEMKKMLKKVKKIVALMMWTAPHLLDSMVYYLTSGVFCYAKRSTKQTIYARIQKMNSTPFVRQYDILSNKWGAVQQKTLRGFYYVVGVDACHRPAGGCKHSPLQFTMQSIRRSAPHAGRRPRRWRPARAGWHRAGTRWPARRCGP